MKISALVFDLDGTAIPKHPDGLPSQKVIDAVRKAQEKIFVSVATGRPDWLAEKVLTLLNIDKPCILSGGTQLYNPETKEYIWEQPLSFQMSQQITNILVDYECRMGSEKDKNLVHPKDFKVPQKAFMLAVLGVEIPTAQSMKEKLSSVAGIATHLVSSWTPGTLDVHVTHELATKKHALEALLAHHNLSIDETMVVGDGGNDLPLFELAGLKIAMGNAEEELKAEADWIAPSVDEDGLAVAIEKYILKES